MTRGPIVRQFCVGRNRETLDGFHGFFTPILFALLVYLSEVFTARLESFWSSYWMRPPYRQLRS